MRSAAAALVLLLLQASNAVADRVDLAPALGFETPDSRTTYWLGATAYDSMVVHAGHWSALLDRPPGAAGQFSAVSARVPRDFVGDTLEIRGWLKFEGVTGFTGLWQRQDGPAERPVEFDNMRSRGLRGTAPWTEYRIRLPLSPQARNVVFGALLVGNGKVWLDDMSIEVDGKPLASLPVHEAPNTIFDRDTAFTASSGLTLERVSDLQRENLVRLGKVWGFLKYHHPAVVRGERNWDFDLFRVAPRVLAAPNAATAERVLAAWVDSLGAVKPCVDCVQLPADARVRPRLDWIRNRAWLGNELSARLVAIHASRPDTTEQFYVSHLPGVRNPSFDNEAAYARLREPDAGYRLLALFRLWNIVEYWAPNRELADRDWDATLREFVPRMLAARTRDDYRRETLALVARIHDTHANLWSAVDEVRPPVGKAGLPVTVRFVANQAVVAGYSNPRLGPATGLRVGDIVAAIDGTPVATLVERWRPLYCGSNDATRRRDMARSLTIGAAGPVSVQVLRDRERLTLQAIRVPVDSLDRAAERVHDHAGPTFRRLSDDVAYLKLSSVKSGEVRQYLAGMQGARCVVIDIRNYPSAFMVFELGEHLVREKTPFVKFTAGDTRNPGTFSIRGDPLILAPVDPYLEGQVAVLVDETTQSQAEYTTMAFRARPGTLVVGSQTAGADGNVSSIPLPGGERTMISGIGVLYPDGRDTQGIGIVPDLVVHPTVAGLKAGRDEVLEAAVRKLLGRDLTDAERRALAEPVATVP